MDQEAAEVASADHVIDEQFTGDGDATDAQCRYDSGSSALSAGRYGQQLAIAAS